MPLAIKVLGCSGGACGALRTTALLLGTQTLMDCGTGVGDLTLDEMAQIQDVFLTHAHLDHVLFLPLLSDAALALRQGPLIVHALPETIAALKTHLLNGVLWPDYSALPSPDAPYIRFAPIRLGDTAVMENYRITPLPARHTVPAVGYLIETDDGSLAFSGDSAFCEAFWEALQAFGKLRYVMVETTMRDCDTAVAKRSLHTTPSTLARAVERMPRGAQLLVTHIEPDKVAEVRAEVITRLQGIIPHFVQRGDVFTL